jgi:hypothetical protein
VLLNSRPTAAAAQPNPTPPPEAQAEAVSRLTQSELPHLPEENRRTKRGRPNLRVAIGFVCIREARLPVPLCILATTTPKICQSWWSTVLPPVTIAT